MKRDFSRQIFEKWANNKFHENPFSWNQVAACGQTDTHDDANGRFSQFSERARQNSASQTTPHISIPILKHSIIRRFSEDLTDIFNSFCYTYRIFRHMITLTFDEEY